MLPLIKKAKRQQKKDKRVDDLFQEYEEQPQTNQTFKYEIMQNLEPVHIDGIFYYQKKLMNSIHFDTINMSKNSNNSKNQIKNKSMKDLNSYKEYESLQDSNIFTPRGNNLQPFINATFGSVAEPKARQTSPLLSQRSFIKSKSHTVIQVDEIEETENFEELYQEKQKVLENIQSEAHQKLPQHLQEEYQKRWGEVNISIKKIDRNLQQEVSQTMKLINNNMKQIVIEQENKKIIRNLTSLESIFQQARNECIDMNIIDLTNDKVKKPKVYLTNNSVLQSQVIQLPTINPIPPIKTQGSDKDYQIDKSNLKFKSLNDSKFKNMRSSSNSKFAYMYSRFIKKLNSPHLTQESIIQKRSSLLLARKKYINEYPRTQTQKPYQSLIDIIPANPQRQTTLTSEDTSNGNSIYLPIFQANLNSRSKFLNDQLFNNSNLDRSKMSTINSSTIHTLSNGNLLQTINISDNTASALPKSISSQKIKIIPKKVLPSKNKQIQLPKFLVPYQQLILNTWKGKIGPTAEENVLYSNSLGMLSLHKDMTEGVHHIKEFEFKEDQTYLAVPSKSTRIQKNAEKKFSQAIKNNELTQQLINLNIQQLDQIIELVDPADYLLSDNY